MKRWAFRRKDEDQVILEISEAGIVDRRDEEVLC